MKAQRQPFTVFGGDLAPQILMNLLTKWVDDMTTRTRFIAEYFYPGTFVAETASVEIDMPTRKAAEEAKPKGTVGYTDRCYAIKITEVTDRLWESDGEYKWLPEGNATLVDSWVYGEEIHIDDIPDTPENRILRSNIRCNSDDGYAVRHIGPGWTLRRDWNRVVTP